MQDPIEITQLLNDIGEGADATVERHWQYARAWLFRELSNN